MEKGTLDLNNQITIASERLYHYKCTLYYEKYTRDIYLILCKCNKAYLITIKCWYVVDNCTYSYVRH